MPKINLALAGGGLKSYVQIGVLEKLEEENMQINAVSGTSMGSCIAALFALNLDAKTIKEEMLGLETFFQDNHLFIKPSVKLLPFSHDRIEGGYIDGEVVEKELERVFAKYGAYSIRDVKKPLAIPAVDLTSGKLVVFVNDKNTYKNQDPDHIVDDEISLAKAVRASASIPFIFSSVSYKDYLLADGGVRLNVPLPLLKGFSDHKTLAITTKKEIEALENTSLISLALQVYNINSNEFDMFLAKQADYFINFPLGRLQFSLGKGDEIIQKAKAYLDESDDLKSIKEDLSIFPFSL